MSYVIYIWDKRVVWGSVCGVCTSCAHVTHACALCVPQHRTGEQCAHLRCCSQAFLVAQALFLPTAILSHITPVDVSPSRMWESS